MPPNLGYLHQYSVTGVKAVDNKTEIHFENGAYVSLHDSALVPDIVGLSLLTTFKPDAETTTMRFGRTQKIETEPGFEVIDENDISIYFLNYSIVDPSHPDDGDFFPEVPVVEPAPDPEREQWLADRTAEGPEAA